MKVKIKSKLTFFSQQIVLDTLFSRKILEENGNHFTRLSSPVLYRGDTRRPEVIFNEGFIRRIKEGKECLPSITANIESKNCIATSKDIISAVGFADCPVGTHKLCTYVVDKAVEYSWVYMIYSEHGLDLTLIEPAQGNYNKSLSVNEVALTNVLPEHVMAAFQIKTTKNSIASYLGPYNKSLHQHTSSWQILVTQLVFNENCTIRNEFPAIYAEAILKFKAIYEKGYIRIPWSPFPDDPEFLITHSLNANQKEAYKLGLAIEDAKRISTAHQVEGLKVKFTLVDITADWFSAYHVAAANNGISIEQLRFKHFSQAYGLGKGLSLERLEGITCIEDVDALLLGFTREDIASKWFSPKHMKAASNNISVDFLRGLTWKSYDIYELIGMRFENNYDKIEQLLAHGASPNISPEAHRYRRTLLLEAMRHNKADIVELLLKFHANPNETKIISPLFFAVLNSLEELCVLLIKYGAKKDEEFNLYGEVLCEYMIDNDTKIKFDLFLRRNDGWANYRANFKTDLSEIAEMKGNSKIIEMMIPEENNVSYSPQ